MSQFDEVEVEGGEGIQVDLRHLLSESLDAVFIVDRSTGVIRGVNRRCEELTGYCLDELVGNNVEVLSPRQPSPKMSPTIWEELLEQPGLHEEVRIERSDGRCFLAEMSVTLTTVKAKQTSLLFMRDLTERRKLERELITKHLALKEAYEELERTNKELERASAEIQTAQRWLVHLEKMATIGRFAAGVAHEVNNPMAFVLENLAQLRGIGARRLPAHLDHLDGARRRQLEATISEQQELIQETIEGADRVSQIMRQLHSFSNVSDQEMEPTNLHSLLESSIMMVNNQIRYRARLERHYYDVPEVLCVPNNISQVIVNLLVNAVHALEDGNKDQDVILVRTRTTGDQVVLEIQDTGCGIPPENLSRIMEPFFSTKARGTGTGLGLSISASIVEQHGGTLEVESEVGRGTIVRMKLPVRSAPPATAEAKQPTPEATRKLQLLIVDDEVYYLRAMKRGLGRAHAVLLSSNAGEALQILAEHKVDLILLDLMMPEMDGVELYKILVNAHPYLEKRVIFVSGGVFEESIKASVKSTGLEVLNKPFKHEELHSAIDRMGIWQKS